MHFPNAPAKFMENVENIQVTVIYAVSDHARIVPLTLKRGSTLIDAIKQSGLEQEVKLPFGTEIIAGVYGRRQKPDYCLRDGDRVELYRQLKFDPKEARRRRAEKLSSQ